jgi:hypothetical protein
MPRKIKRLNPSFSTEGLKRQAPRVLFIIPKVVDVSLSTEDEVLKKPGY